MGTRLVQNEVGEIVKGNGEEITKVLAEQGRPPFLSVPVLPCRIGSLQTGARGP